MDSYYKICKNVKIVKNKQNSYVIIKNKKVIRLGIKETELLLNIIGSPIQDIYNKCLPCNRKNLESFILYLKKNKIIEENENKSFIKVYNNNNWSIILLSKYLIYLTPIFIVFSMFNVWKYSEDLIVNLRNINVTIPIFILLFSIKLHEMGHSIIARYYGCYVLESYIKIYRLSVYGKTEVYGIDNIKDVYKEIIIYVSGILVNANIFSVAGILYRINKIYSPILSVIIIINLLLVIINFIPINNSDGQNIYACLKNIR